MKYAKNKDYRFVGFNCGFGVQSTAILLLLKHDPQILRDAMGHLPDLALFADTGAEPAHVYRHIDDMIALGLPVPVKVVRNGSILSPKGTRSFVPYFLKTEEGENEGMILRKCTQEFKIIPIEKAIRDAMGLVPKQRSEAKSAATWIGISMDEAIRMKPNPNRMIDNLFPLIEIGWDRQKCLEYCAYHKVYPPKSRCYFCPFIKDWARVRAEEPEEFKRACEYDEWIREHSHEWGLRGKPYLHRRLKPLAEAVEEAEFERKAKMSGMVSLFPDWDESGFGQECTGYCGV
jgi:hypothetical protein